MSTPFKNNLRTGDQVFHAKMERRGLVSMQPRESGRNVAVIFDGTTSVRYVDVMDLRYISPGDKIPEDNPPIEGEPPPLVPKAAAPAVRVTKVQPGDPVELLRSQKAANETALKELSVKFNELTSHNRKIDAALNALTKVE